MLCLCRRVLRQLAFQTIALAEEAARYHGIERVVLPHLAETRTAREELVAKALAAVKARLTSEIQYCDYRAIELKEQTYGAKSRGQL